MASSLLILPRLFQASLGAERCERLVDKGGLFAQRVGSSPLISSNGVPEPRPGSPAGPHGSLLVVAVEPKHLFIGGAVITWAGSWGLESRASPPSSKRMEVGGEGLP